MKKVIAYAKWVFDCPECEAENELDSDDFIEDKVNGKDFVKTFCTSCDEDVDVERGD